MQVTFLGGADEVGASCALLETCGRRILIDCGIRMSPRDGDRLPWLGRLQEGERTELDAVVVTHAHTDHTGALPVLMQGYPNVPIYMTEASLDLTQLLMMDALKIMGYAQERDGQPPLYPQAAAERVVGQCCPVSFGQTLSLCDGDVRATWYPAGHILGAGSVLLESSEGSVLFTGDVSVTDQLTVPGMMVPRARPDLVVIESTYGGRLHASRTAEEKRLIAQVGEVLAQRGAILFPAFAIGRAQEVILILSRAIERGQLPNATIFVDGMVQSVCGIYSNHAALLPSWLRKRCEKLGNPFFGSDTPAQPVRIPKLRRQAARQRPAIYVSSSGMLTGGPSQFYAGALAEDPNSFIAITGYQDEESPGRKVQQLARDGGGALRIGSQTVQLQCGVGTYSLSAHADTAQIVGVLAALKPNAVALVHGDAGARASMANAIEQNGIASVHLPGIGTTLTVSRKGKGKRRTIQPAAATTQRDSHLPSAEELPAFALSLIAAHGLNRYYRVQDLLKRWDPEGFPSPDTLQALRDLIEQHPSLFQRHRKRAFLFRVHPQHAPSPAQQAPKPPKSERRSRAGRFPQTRAQEIVRERFAHSDNALYKVSCHLGQHALVLHFHFPDVAKERFRDELAALETETGWSISLSPSAHQGALAEYARGILPPDTALARNPSIHLDQRRLTLHLAQGDPDSDVLRQAVERFHHDTGFTIELEVQHGTQAPPVLSTHIKRNNNARRMEINKAYGLIRSSFAGLPHPLIKVSLKNNTYIQLTFVTPQIGVRHQELIEDLSKRVGYELRVRRTPDQHRLKEFAKTLVPPSWTRLGEPGIVQEKTLVRIKVAAIVDPDEIPRLSEQMHFHTGYQLAFHT